MWPVTAGVEDSLNGLMGFGVGVGFGRGAVAFGGPGGALKRRVRGGFPGGQLGDHREICGGDRSGAARRGLLRPRGYCDHACMPGYGRRLVLTSRFQVKMWRELRASSSGELSRGSLPNPPRWAGYEKQSIGGCGRQPYGVATWRQRVAVLRLSVPPDIRRIRRGARP